MSQENVAAVRLAYDVAFAQRSLEGVRHAFADDYVFHTRPEWPGRALYGIDEMPRLWADVDDSFSEYTLVAEDFGAVGDEYVLVTLRQGARMRGSATRIEMPVFHIWNVRNGIPRETWSFGTREEALQAAGTRD